MKRINESEGDNKSNLEKVLIELEEDAWHGHAVESVWVEKVGKDRYRIMNVPFYAYGLSIEDVIVTKDYRGTHAVLTVVERSGHSTYRLFLAEGVGIDSQVFRENWILLQNLGCTYERATRSLLAVDVPPLAEIHEVYQLLEHGVAAGVWDFEEGHCGHKTEENT